MSVVDTDDHPAQVIIRIAATSNTDTSVDDILETTASTAVFGRKMIPVGPSNPLTYPDQPIMGVNQDWIPLKQPLVDDMGCATAIYPPKQANFIGLVKRGGCTFFQKLVVAKRHGADGVVVYGREEDGIGLIRPSADGEQVIDVEDVGMVYIPFEVGKNIAERLNEGESISVAFEALEYESVRMDMDSVLDLLDYDREDLKGFLGDINLDDLDADIQRLESMLSRSTSTLMDEIKAWKQAVELEAEVFRDLDEKKLDDMTESALPPPPTPPPPPPARLASVTVLGRPVANLLIMPPSS